MNSVNVTAYIGHDYGIGVWTTEQVYESVAMALRAFGIDGATLSEAVGMWRGHLEQSTRVELLSVDEETAKAALTAICADLAQYEIVYTVNGHGMAVVVADAATIRAEMAEKANNGKAA